MAKRYLGLLFLVVCTVFVCSEIAIRFYVLEYHRLAQQVFKILNSNEKNVIIGDSHTKAAFEDLPPDFINLSVEGMNVLMFDAVLKSYESRNQIDKIIILASPHIFSQYRVKGATAGIYSSLPNRRLDWRDDIYVFNSVYQAALYDIVKWKIINILQSKNPFELIKIRVLQALGVLPPRINDLENPNIVGKNPLWKNFSSDQKIKDTQRCLYDHAPVDHFEDHGFAHQYKAMINRLSDEGVHICLVRTPVSEIYNKMYKEKFDMPLMEKFFRDIAKESDLESRVKYVSYEQLGIVFTDDLLRNTDHTNEKGAAIFAPAIIAACFGK